MITFSFLGVTNSDISLSLSFSFLRLTQSSPCAPWATDADPTVSVKARQEKAEDGANPVPEFADLQTHLPPVEGRTRE